MAGVCMRGERKLSYLSSVGNISVVTRPTAFQESTDRPAYTQEMMILCVWFDTNQMKNTLTPVSAIDTAK